MAATEQERGLEYARRMLEGFQYSELTVRCRGREWKVHHFMLRMYSFFDACLTYNSQLGQENLLELSDADDPATIHRMLTWMYVSDYDDEPAVQAVTEPANDPQSSAGPDTQSETSSSTILGSPNPANAGGMQPHLGRALINIDVYCIAEKYQIGRLQKVAIDRCLAQSWATWTLEELTVLVKKLYSSVPRSCKPLRKKLINDCADQMPGFFVKEDGTCAIEDVGNFASDLSQELQIRECDKQIVRLEQQLTVSKFDGCMLQMQLSEAQMERDIAVQQLDLTIKATQNEDNCKECGARFGAYLLPQLFPNIPLPITCKSCHTTH